MQERAKLTKQQADTAAHQAGSSSRAKTKTAARSEGSCAQRTARPAGKHTNRGLDANKQRGRKWKRPELAARGVVANRQPWAAASRDSDRSPRVPLEFYSLLEKNRSYRVQKVKPGSFFLLLRAPSHPSSTPWRWGGVKLAGISMQRSLQSGN